VEAMTMADRIVVLRGGNVEQIGTPLQLYDRPDNMFVAGFLGSPSMNFLRGTVEGKSLRLATGEQLSLSSVPNGHAGEVVVGIRPQDIVINGAEGTPAVVKLVEPTGADTHVLLDVGGKEMTCVVNDRVDFAPGHQITVSIASPKIHFFDPASEKRLADASISRADVA